MTGVTLFAERSTESPAKGVATKTTAPSLPAKAVNPRARGSQDAATRAWNFVTALYYKSGGVPWRLQHIDPGVCFVGVSFYKEISASGPRLRTSMAQTFTSNGDGFVLRGSTFEWDETSGDVLRIWMQHPPRRSCGAFSNSTNARIGAACPTRLVVHKRSRFWDEELEGFQNGAEQVPSTDFVAIGERGIRFFRPGDFPPLRGTYVKFSETIKGRAKVAIMWGPCRLKIFLEVADDMVHRASTHVGRAAVPRHLDEPKGVHAHHSGIPRHAPRTYYLVAPRTVAAGGTSRMSKRAEVRFDIPAWFADRVV